MKSFDLSLYLVTDQRCPWENCLTIISEAICGGVTMVQLREKHAPKNEIFHRANDLLKMLEPLGVPLIINDHVDIVAAVGAHGVHLGKNDSNVKQARKILGDQAIIGLSVESVDDFALSEFEFCDYVSASPIFPTTSKDDAAKPIGLDGLVKLREVCTIPLVAIGGIDESNAALVASTGVEGICVVSSIFSSPTPELTARRLKKIFQLGRKGHIDAPH